MANNQKGEVDLQVGPKLYTMQITWNAIAKFEATQDVSWFQDFAPKLGEPNSIRVGEWIALLWAGLHGHQPSMTLSDAGDIMTELGAPATIGAIMSCLSFTFPDAPEVVENPPKASPKSGTGKKRS